MNIKETLEIMENHNLVISRVIGTAGTEFLGINHLSTLPAVEFRREIQ